MERFKPRQKFSRAALAMIVCITLNGCGGPQFLEDQPAQITKREFIPEHLIPQTGSCLISDEDGVCYLRETKYVLIPDQYQLQLQQCEEVAEGEKPSCAVEVVDVSRTEFVELQEGQWVRIDPDGGVDRVAGQG
jgi:hypothetical protein